MNNKSTAIKPSRREFLQSAAAVTAGSLLTGWLGTARSLAAESKSPNARPRIAGIGNGGRGSGDTRAASAYGDIVALCDVDRVHAERLNASLKLGGRTQLYDDYRRVLERKDIDVVVIGTPDHWHAKIAAEAMRAGKDVYCEKPLTLTIDEGKLLCRVVKETGRVLQVGTQQRSECKNMFITAAAMVRDGRIGKVKRVVCAIGGSRAGGPFEKTAPPATLNWDMWQGQTPKVDYIKERSHNTFRWWYEYSGGKMTDWGAHHVDIATWAIGMDESGPTSVEVLARDLPVPFKNGYPTADNCYNTATKFRIRCLFPNGVEMIILDGSNTALPYPNGIQFEGETGTFFVNRQNLEGDPVEALEKKPISPALFAKLRHGKPLGDHMGNFFQCVHDRGMPVSDVFSHHRALTTCHLASIAIRLGRKLQWDAAKEEIIGDAEANTFLKRECRKGYEIQV